MCIHLPQGTVERDITAAPVLSQWCKVQTIPVYGYVCFGLSDGVCVVQAAGAVSRLFSDVPTSQYRTRHIQHPPLIL